MTSLTSTPMELLVDSATEETKQQPSTRAKLSQKQDIAIQLLNHPQIVEIDFGGAAGGGKTLLICLWMLLELRKYPGIRIALGRKEGVRLRQTTVLSLLREAHPIMGVTEGEYAFNDQKGLIQYKNGSQIQLLDLAYQPSDPDFDTFGSMLYTHVVMEEVGEIKKKARDVLGSRTNRWMNDKYNIVGKIILTQNPSQNFTRQEFYEPYKKLGMGDYRIWPIGKVEVDGAMKTAYRAFVKSLPTDNPFISRNYIETLKRLPDQERKRLLKGDWDYMDQSDGLFPSVMIDRSIAYELPQKTEEDAKLFTKFIGLDIADKGKDNTIGTLIDNGIALEQKKFEVDTSGEKPISELISLEIIKWAQQHGFTPATAKQIAVEGNGVGVGVRDFMRSKGWFITVYEATGISRSAGFWTLHLNLENGKLRMHIDFDQSEDGEIRKQLAIYTYEMDDQLRPIVIKKKLIKEELGYSPDETDSLMIGSWIMSGGAALLDPKKDTSRIIF